MMRRRIRDSMVATHALIWEHECTDAMRAASPQAVDRAKLRNSSLHVNALIFLSSVKAGHHYSS